MALWAAVVDGNVAAVGAALAAGASVNECAVICALAFCNMFLFRILVHVFIYDLIEWF